MTKEQIRLLTAEKGVYEKVTPAQNHALHNLIVKLQTQLEISKSEVYPHSEVSRKNPTEAVTANWIDTR